MAFSLLLFSWFSYADNFCDTIRYSVLRAADWTYLWYLSNNSADTESIACSYWSYWASYEINSIFNSAWLYWASYALNSPWCNYTVDAPYIYKWDWYWRLTLNPSVIWWLNTFDVVLCFVDPFDDRLKAYVELDKWNKIKNKQEESCQYQFWSYATVAEERWKCKCKAWYVRDTWMTKCIADENEQCKIEFWLFSISWWPWQCKCVDWYQWNTNKTSCVKSKTQDEICQEQYWLYSYSPEPGYCNCKDWYEWGLWKTTCIKSTTTTINCDSFWPNAIASNNGQCTCKDNYEWNYNKNWCVADRNNKKYWWKDFRSAKDWEDYINMLLDFEWEIEDKQNTQANTTITEKTYDNKIDELKDAILWMYDNWLTRYQDINNFLPYNEITREQAAKFFVEFAAKVLWKEKWNIETYDIFNDIEQTDPTLKDYVVYSNNMKMFNGNNWYFMPNNNLTIAQAIAVLIRIVDWNLDESWTSPYYDVKWDNHSLYAWYAKYMWHLTYYKLDKWDIAKDVDNLDSQNITRWDLSILIYEMSMYLSNPDNRRL